jgi:23S rRNA (guanosine2251-2'-O)-methyltransferase
MIFALNNIRSAWNVGSAFRTADCLGSDLFLVGYTPRPTAQNLKLISKTAIGAENYVKYESFQNYFEVFEKYPDKLHLAIDITQNSLSLFEFFLEYKNKIELLPSDESDFVLWFGNEIHGLEKDLMSLCKHTLHLPMYGKKESLNIASSLAATAYLFKFALSTNL